MKLLAVCFACLGSALSAQSLDLRHLDRLAEKSGEVVNVTLDEGLIRLASSFLKGGGDDLREIRNILPGLKGIYVRSYNFESDNVYSAADVEKIEQQLKGWSTIVETRKARSRESSKVMIKQGGGIVVLNYGPRELTVVNVEGTITVDQLERLGGHLGIPEIDVQKEKSRKKEKDEE
jgi:hypothetical protein